MPETLPSIELEQGVWTDIYLATGITEGTKIAVQNIGSSDVYLAISSVEPELDSIAYVRIQPNDFPMANDSGDVGAWAFSPNQDGRISVWVAT